MSNHGGVRKGAGRPKGSKVAEPTKGVRVPLGAEHAVKSLIKCYKQHNEASLRNLTSMAETAALELGQDSAFLLAFALTNQRAAINSVTLIDNFKTANAHLLSPTDELIDSMEDNEDWVGFDD
ncbi:hypothetical protein EXU30_00335 [Shewanella maritima]|uniref:Uncharacterized protein n=1 Tax=Shewanella maritima TaxID=2520507 RepID=A0A411PCN9_9GAMM|nr:hypothetical protein [Shewanella maritima]QBF81281.1 hypothetical protein EXU30_00155 [Shewanella maritima]QBF81289.1 hypothetical protein EXU30_00195 [Shewanella maritima]QBF81298.1 hypothetical protein EXU30_00240 [Shewanella maritima]QBF81308.1 hypothetical protein EXU30_00290 [Shewanella maritima]QBF81317.1 hypothetical protein EXU30_00335 [Shewanella maritima]